MAPERADDDEYGRIYEALATRRKVLAGTAAIGSAALAGCTGGLGPSGGTPTGDGNSSSSDGTSGSDGNSPTAPADGTPTEGDSGGTTKAKADVDVLNYALTLEHLEHAFYRDGLEAFSDDEIRNAEQVSNFDDDDVRMDVPKRIDTIRAHEKGHVDAISSVVEDLGGDPVGEADYTFEYGSPKKFLATAKVLENTGVAAYKGAAPAIKSNEILASALGIHSVEARHASFLNFLNRTTPYPEAFDAPKSPGTVKEAANPFFDADIAGSETNLGGENEPTADRKAEDDTSDVDVLNYALTLEHLEHAFYRDGLEAFSDEEIRGANVLAARFGEEVVNSAPGRLRSIRDHEKAHVDAITKTVEKLGGDPVGEAEYSFGYETPTEFLATAQVLENTGVAAYAGAAPTVENDKVFVAAAKIHSVEARHAGFLNELNRESPYPNAVDGAKSMKEVEEAAGQFIEGM